MNSNFQISFLTVHLRVLCSGPLKRARIKPMQKEMIREITRSEVKLPNCCNVHHRENSLVSGSSSADHLVSDDEEKIPAKGLSMERCSLSRMRKGKFTFRNRNSGAEPKSPPREKKWTNDHDESLERKLRGTDCCVKLKYLKKVIYSFVMTESHRLITSS